MKKKHIVMILYIMLIIFVMLSNVSFSNASNPTTTTTTAVKQENTDLGSMYDVLQPGQNPLASGTKIVLGIIRWVGTAILIGAVIVKGIKYVTAAPDGKAEIKKDMIMLFIGALLLFGFTKLIDIIYDLVVHSGLTPAIFIRNT